VYRVPFTAIRAQDLVSADLAEYNVIVLPDGSASGYARIFGEDGTARLRSWVEQGGTLVGIKGAALWAAAEKVGLTTARDKFSVPPEGDKEKKEPPKRMAGVPGAYVSVEIDAEHHLGTGMSGSAIALFRSNTVFLPSKKGARAASLHKERPIVSGFAFDDAKGHLSGAPFLWDEPTGRGHVTLFADDVCFRTYLHGAHRLFLNAVLLGPSFGPGGRGM